MQHTLKAAVSLPKELLGRIERVRSIAGVNRSKFFQIALQEYLERCPGEEEKKLASLYQQVQKTDKKLLQQFSRHSYKHLPPYNEEG